MLPTINGKPIISCNLEDLQIIVGNPDYRENEYIDYKENFAFLEFDKQDPRKIEHKAEFKSDICSFANTEGGYLIFGVREQRGIASELIGVDISNNNTDKFELDCKNILQGILPKMPSIKFHFILLNNGKYLVILLIQKDSFSPYVHLLNESNYRIYKRVGNGKATMSYSEMKMQFNQSLSLDREIDHFRKSRIDYFRSIEDDTDAYSRFILLHIIPDTFLDRSHNKSMYILNRQNNNKISRIFSPFDCSSYVRPNVDGIHTVAYRGAQAGQLFDSGIAECFIPVSDNYLSKGLIGDVTFDCFNWVSFWDQLSETVNNYIDTISTIIDTKRVFVCLSIIGCRGVITNESFTIQESAKIDRAVMIANPVVFENIRNANCVYVAMKRLRIDLHLSLGLGLTSEEIYDIENGRI